MTLSASRHARLPAATGMTQEEVVGSDLRRRWLHHLWLYLHIADVSSGARAARRQRQLHHHTLPELGKLGTSQAPAS